MSEQSFLDEYRPLPSAGSYPVPGRGEDEVVERAWDSEVWLDETRPAPDGTSLTDYERQPFSFLKAPGWKYLLVLIVAMGIGIILKSIDSNANFVSGIQYLLPVFSLIGTLSLMAAFLHFLGRRVGFDRIELDTRKAIFLWGLLSGLVALGLAYLIEYLPLPFLQGPAEEIPKLLIPVILWMRGQFRVPREGYLLVLVSAVVFGCVEAFKYGFHPDVWDAFRPFTALLHPLITGVFAAVVWQVAFRKNSIFSWTALGTLLFVMVAHSATDGFTLAPVVVFPLMYLVQKHFARQLVPPDLVDEVSPGWRPVPPKNAH